LFCRSLHGWKVATASHDDSDACFAHVIVI
jgi:hypothetical protein